MGIVESLGNLVKVFEPSEAEKEVMDFEYLKCPKCRHYMPAFYFAPERETGRFSNPEKMQDCYNNCGEIIHFNVNKLKTMTGRKINKLKESGIWHTQEDYITKKLGV